MNLWGSRRDKERAQQLHDEAWHREREGAWTEAEQLYRGALECDPKRADTCYNLGLICKYQGRWQESLTFNQRALELDPRDEAALWNLGIAATAVSDWPTARRAWKAYGVALPAGAGPIEMDLGIVPVRLNPSGEAEVVWTRRIDPARAIIQSVPQPATGFGCRDLLLHDGAPNGYRLLNGQEVPVFDALALLEPSSLSTFVVEVETPDPDAVQSLESRCEQAGLEMEDWTQSLRRLCKACSEGKPYDAPGHIHDRDNVGATRRRIGIASHAEEPVRKVLYQWTQQTGCTVLSLTCALDRSQQATTFR